MMMKTMFTPVAPSVALKPSAMANKANKPTALNDVPALKTLEADTVSFRSGQTVIGADLGGTGFKWLPLRIAENGDTHWKPQDRQEIPTPQHPDELVKILASIAKGEEGSIPKPLASGFPGILNDEGIIQLAANLPPAYTNYPLIPNLKKAIGYDEHSETKGFEPPFGNDMKMQAAGLPDDGRDKIIIALGTGAGNGAVIEGKFQGAELGHAPYTTRGTNYPLAGTYEQMLCDLPRLFQARVIGTAKDPEASKELKSLAQSLLKDRDLKANPFTLEDWKKAWEAEHPIAKSIVRQEWRFALADFTQTLLLAKLPASNRTDAYFGGTVIEKLMPRPMDIDENVTPKVLSNTVISNLHGQGGMKFLHYPEGGFTAFIGAGKEAYKALKSLHALDLFRF